MRCIFCKKDSSASRSAEHIIPESLGNTSHILKPGIVCDRCNNYFSRKVEKPFLESPEIKQLRFHQAIPSKKGKIPPIAGVMSPGVVVDVYRPVKDDDPIHIDIPIDADLPLDDFKTGQLVIPAPDDSKISIPSNQIVSRFMAKVALESMVQRVSDHSEGIEYMVDEAQLDPIRDHARQGKIAHWPVHVRRIYGVNQRWIDESGESVQLVHESDILHTSWDEWFFVLSIFGLELVINYGGAEISGYLRWLEENDHASPLYLEKNASVNLQRG